MGIFSKKTYICDKCGKPFETRLGILGNTCGECCIKEEKEKKALESSVRGYNNYSRAFFYKSYNADEMKAIIEHREALLEKFQSEVEITREELAYAGSNMKNLTEDEALDVIVRYALVSVRENVGAAYTKRFFVLTDYESVIIDSADIFAVGYTTDFRSQATSCEVILCAVFTNDPYIPVFPMVYVMKKGLFEFSKSKGGRELVNQIFETNCPNLTYPVGDIRDLKKQIKEDGFVKGNLDVKFMMDNFSVASAGAGIFDSSKMRDSLLPETQNMINRMGYIPEAEANMLLRMDKKAGRDFWMGFIDRVLEDLEYQR